MRWRRGVNIPVCSVEMQAFSFKCFIINAGRKGIGNRQFWPFRFIRIFRGRIPHPVIIKPEFNKKTVVAVRLRDNGFHHGSNIKLFPDRSLTVGAFRVFGLLDITAHITPREIPCYGCGIPVSGNTVNTFFPSVIIPDFAVIFIVGSDIIEPFDKEEQRCFFNSGIGWNKGIDIGELYQHPCLSSGRSALKQHAEAVAVYAS